MKRFTVFFSLTFLICANSLALQNDALSASLLSIRYIKQEPQQEKVKQDHKKAEKQQQPEQPQIKEVQIKEVPKARRQLKPMAVKPNVKAKPIKIIKPKIKRP